VKFAPKKILIIVHDLFQTALALLAALYLRFEFDGLIERFGNIFYWLPVFILYAGTVYFFFGLYKSKWRFASLHDLVEIVRASTVLAISLLVLDYVLIAQNLHGSYFFGKITIALYWILQIFCLGGPRMVYRYFRYVLTQQHQSADRTASIIVGRTADAEILLRAIESGAVKNISVIGLLSPSKADQGQTLRGVPVLNFPNALEAVIDKLQSRNVIVHRLVLTPEVLTTSSDIGEILAVARRRRIAINRLPSMEGKNDKVQLLPIAVEDLLLRPSVQINFSELDRFLTGKSVVVTGGGGSIGAELCDRVVAFRAARLLIIDSSEPALYNIVEELKLKTTTTQVEGRIADVRDRERIFRLLHEFRPDMVFHAAALKHVLQSWSVILKKRSKPTSLGR
jgi:O-antigen biosynthesis protein WbqV